MHDNETTPTPPPESPVAPPPEPTAEVPPEPTPIPVSVHDRQAVGLTVLYFQHESPTPYPATIVAVTEAGTVHVNVHWLGSLEAKLSLPVFDRLPPDRKPNLAEWCEVR